MELRYQINGDLKTIQIERDGDSYRVRIGERTYHVSARQAASGALQLIVDGERHTAIVARNGSTRFVFIDATTLELNVPESGRAARRHHASEGSLTASMPGQVIKVLVSDGDTIERGQTLMILEAMKMEIRVSAPRAGQVAKLYVKQGQVVDRGQILAALKDATS